MRPLILITNDDGIRSEGLFLLSQAVKKRADVVVVAPEKERSACSVSITWNHPLKITQVAWTDSISAWEVNGTPADCVKMATHLLCKKAPDLILSGINYGSNAGRTVLYSGTVAGAIEGTLKQIPAIAFSFAGNKLLPLEEIQPYIDFVIDYVLKNSLPEGTLLNVNFPNQEPKDWLGTYFTKQGKARWVENPDERTHPEGNLYYWLGGRWETTEKEEEDSDVLLLEKGYVTITPLKVGHLTDENLLSHLKNQKVALPSFVKDPL